MTNADQITTRFLNSVASVGFSNTEKIKAEIRRLANNPLFQSFLEDFSSSVTNKNLISTKQWKKFKDLDLSESDFSLDSTKQEISDVRKKNQKLNQKNDRISKQLERSYSYKEKLEAQLFELEQQQARKLNEKENLTSKFERSKQQYKLNLAENEKAISGYFQKLSEVNIDLDVMSNTVQDTSNETVLMSHADLGSLLTAEDEYTRQMASYAKKQFTQATAGIQDVNTSFSENISDITAVEETTSELEEKKHLERIMCGYKARKLRLILAKAAENQANGLKSFLEGKVSLGATKTQGFKNIHELASAASEAELQSHNILKDLLPKLLDKCARLERSMLLAGDCRLQLAKQKYLTNKQTQMINLLVQQLSRLVLVWMLLKLETSQHENLVRGLHKWSSELEKDLSSVKQRTEHLNMSNVAHRKPSKAKAVIDNRDTAMLSVYTALGKFCYRLVW
ncbi:HAUS augmin-like complex subunit 3 [Ciona intestinalis]